MIFIIGLLTVVMVLDCVVLTGLILIQLPKKDTGGGLAFGGGASDALFGAGSGNVLTKVTKYAAGIFFALAVLLSILQKQFHNKNTSEFERTLMNPGAIPHAVMPAPPPSAPPATAPSMPLPATNTLLTLPVNAETTNAPPASTNAAPPPPRQ
jgi:preprotein translocase subunit SecG